MIHCRSGRDANTWLAQLRSVTAGNGSLRRQAQSTERAIPASVTVRYSKPVQGEPKSSDLRHTWPKRDALTLYFGLRNLTCWFAGGRTLCKPGAGGIELVVSCKYYSFFIFLSAADSVGSARFSRSISDCGFTFKKNKLKKYGFAPNIAAFHPRRR